MTRASQRMLGTGAAVALAVTLSACGGSQTRVAVRSCTTAGQGGLAADYRQHSWTYGPFALANLRTISSTGAAPVLTAAGRAGAAEVIAVVNAGAEVTLMIPSSERRTVGLLYQLNKFRDDGAYRVADMDPSVRFVACTSKAFNHGRSQFDGGFVISTARCVTFTVSVRGQGTRTGRFSAGRPCAAS